MSYRSLPLWHETCGVDLTPRAALSGDLEVDVAIVGPSFAGLWTAYCTPRSRRTYACGA